MLRLLQKLKLAIFASYFCALWTFSYDQALADVKISSDGDGFKLHISNKITVADADAILQRGRDFEYGEFLRVELEDSLGGDLDAAMRIGQVIRKNDSFLEVRGKCFSSCALIYISGVARINSGVIGLHRPYAASAPRNRNEIERGFPAMLQKLRSYVEEMGVTNNFYQQIVNTEPAEMRLFPDEAIERLVPRFDPTYSEILVALDARRYGVEMAGNATPYERCGSVFWGQFGEESHAMPICGVLGAFRARLR